MKKNKSIALAHVRKFFPDVKSITDADENAHLHVTPQDVRKSSKKDHNECAMAQSVKRTFDAKGVIVSRTMAYVIKRDAAVRYQLPESVKHEIVSFDRGAGFAEGEYELQRPSKSARIGRGGHGGRPDRTHENKGKRVFKHYTTGIRMVIGGRKRGTE